MYNWANRIIIIQWASQHLNYLFHLYLSSAFSNETSVMCNNVMLCKWWINYTTHNNEDNIVISHSLNHFTQLWRMKKVFQINWSLKSLTCMHSAYLIYEIFFFIYRYLILDKVLCHVMSWNKITILTGWRCDDSTETFSFSINMLMENANN